MRISTKILFFIFLSFGLVTNNVSNASDIGNGDNPELTDNYHKYGEEVVGMSLNNFKKPSNNIIKTFLWGCEEGGLANLCCPYWNIEVEFTWTGPTIKCNTGGKFKCKENCSDGGPKEPEVEGAGDGRGNN